MNDLIPVDGLKGRLGKPYRPGPELVSAANVAMTLGVPLLLTGEPGCGKTDSAFAVALWLALLRNPGLKDWDPASSEHGLLECYIRSDTRSKDLLYRYDAVRRFGDAQHGSETRRADAQDARHYIDLEPLGRALASPERRVVLVDEIDKAQRDLPNDLLRELDQGQFEIPEIERDADKLFGRPVESDGVPLRRTMGRRHRLQSHQPFIVLTSNEERQLPDAFLRRCVFFYIRFPTDERLLEILQGWYPQEPRDFLVASGVLFNQLRKTQGLTKKPSSSELLRWIEALTTVICRADPQVRDRICRLAASAKRGGDGVPWRDVPSLGCLLKHREDWEKLEAL